MKKITLILFIVAVTLSLHAQVKSTVKGKVPANSPAKLAAFMYDYEGKLKFDTASITNGAFEFKASFPRPQMMMVKLILPFKPGSKGGKPSGSSNIDTYNFCTFYLDGNTDLVFDTSGIVTVRGGKEQKIYEKYSIFFDENRNNSVPFGDDRQAIVSNFIKKYPDSYVSMDQVSQYADVIEPKVFEPMFNSLSKRIQNTDKGKKWKEALALAKRFAAGQPSIDFAMNDTSGRSVSLASYKGKYVLLDFWASWCGPCRATHPNLLKTYSNYKDKNFEILAVSLDTKKELWLEAIATDKITWMQVSDLKGIAGKVPMMYGIRAIPQNFLIDPNGIIVGKNLKGAALDKKLSELLK